MKALSKLSDIQRQRPILDRDRNRDQNPNRNQTETLTETPFFSSEGVPSSAVRGLGGKKGPTPPKAELYGLKASKAEHGRYEWPEALHGLRSWLQRWGVDVDALKSERQALWLAKKLGRQGKRMPPRQAPLFPALLKIQRTLCPVPTGEPRKAPPSAKAVPGTFGAASPVRSISIADYLAEKATGQNGGVHG